MTVWFEIQATHTTTADAQGWASPRPLLLNLGLVETIEPYAATGENAPKSALRVRGRWVYSTTPYDNLVMRLREATGDS